jgi:membrane protein implicated in regulation of membrane protease activity
MNVADIAGWVAAGATMIAAIMTAANLGSRITGWGFVVFLVGAIAWMLVAVTTGQHTLLLSNAFLALVDVFGIWRWLGRRAKLDDGAERAERDTEGTAAPLFRVNLLDDAVIEDHHGTAIASGVGAMAECDNGTISYVMARAAPEGDQARYLAIPWTWLSAQDGKLRLRDAACSLDALPRIDADAWPDTVSAIAPAARWRGSRGA